MEPNSNLNIEVHQATFDKSLNLLSLNCQFLLNFSGFTLKSKTVSEPAPVWNSSFNLEYSEGFIEITFLHNPLLLKEIVLGTSLVPVKDCSGWFDIKNVYGKIGSVRVSVKKEPIENFEEDDKIKLVQIQLVIDQLKKNKEKYLRRLEKLERIERKKSKESVIESSENDLAALEKLRYQIKIKEEELTSQKNEIENSWKFIEKEKKNLSSLQNKVLSFDGRRKGEVLTPLTCPRTPMSAKYENLSDLSLTQPRSAAGVESEHVISTPKSKLIKFE